MGKSSIGLEGELLAKASMDGISVVGSESVAFANDELAKMLGYEEGQELVGRPWQELITPDDTSLSTNQLLTRVEGERDWCGSGVGERRDGGRVPVQMAMHAAEEGVVCVVRDVTVQRERKQKLDRYETFLDTVDDDDSVPDEALRLDTGSDRLFEMLARFGCSREEAQQRHGHDLVVNEGARAYLETGIGRAIDRESSTGSFQRSAETPHGERIVLESRFRLSPATDGPRGCIDVIRDVTARKERERELREARQFNEELVLNAPFSIVRIDEAFQITYVNPRTKEIVGLSEDEESEALGVDIRELPSVAATGEAHRLTPLEEGETVEFEFPFESIYGRKVYLTGRGVPLTKGGEFDGAVLMAVDISERRQQEKAIERQRDELDTLNQINELLLEVGRDLFESPIQGDIERTVCERFAASELYQFAWIGKPEVGGNRLVPDAVAGIDDSDVASIDVTTGASTTGPGPVGQAFCTGTLRVSQDVRSDPSDNPWREVAAVRNVRSMAAVPLAYEGATYGVLAVYASRPLAFSRSEQRGFEILGEAIGYAINASRTRQLLFAERVVELEFQFVDAGEFVIAASDRLDGELTLEGYLSTRNGAWLTYFTIPEGDAERFVEMAREESAVESVRTIGDGSGQVVAMTIASSLLDEIAALGGRVTSASIDEGRGTVVMEVPQSTDLAEFVEQIRSVYPGAELIAKRDEERPIEQSAWLSGDGPLDLTERQREALEAAYRSAYFDWPRESSAEEVAEMLDVSRPTLQAHLRKAERELLSTLLDGVEQETERGER